MSKNFALIGVAGFIAPKHLKAIKETGNRLVAAVDKHDAVGIMDNHFPDANFFTEIERFDRFLEKQRRETNGSPIDYVSICTPNYLHDSHCRLALRVGSNAICEKPLVISPWNLDQLRDLEQDYGKKVYSVLQLRLHPDLIRLKKEIDAAANGHRREICLTYITRRGKWYHQSWKGDVERSGGVAMNIGVHFFDFLSWIYGRPNRSFLHLNQPSRMSGVLELEKARIRWFLSVDANDLPEQVRAKNGHAFRSITVDGEEIDLSTGFTDLHTEVYKDILAGGGFGIEDSQPAIELVYQIRTSTVVSPNESAHPYMGGKS
ncbi:MAG: Gfo/Idh/MocA family oxidoreductase [Planctomycetaceae bacterium]|nr:Gfo/Idh/MocA family oxidoreductase [Planctomycetaceae bacterium]